MTNATTANALVLGVLKNRGSVDPRDGHSHACIERRHVLYELEVTVTEPYAGGYTRICTPELSTERFPWRFGNGRPSQAGTPPSQRGVDALRRVKSCRLRWQRDPRRCRGTIQTGRLGVGHREPAVVRPQPERSERNGSVRLSSLDRSGRFGRQWPRTERVNESETRIGVSDSE